MSGPAVCPGTFDPITLGHLDVIERATHLFGQVIVAVGTNPVKQPRLSAATRIDLVRVATAHLPGVRVAAFDGLLAQWCAQQGAVAIVKGIRSAGDWEAEEPMAVLNRHLGGPDTVFIPASGHVRHISSTMVRQIADLGGDVSALVPDAVAQVLAQRHHPGH